MGSHKSKYDGKRRDFQRNKLSKYKENEFVDTKKPRGVRYDLIMQQAQDAALASDFDTAIDLLFEVYFSGCSLRIPACFEMAKILKKQGKYNEAAKLFTSLLMETVDTGKIYFELAMVSILQRDFKKAEEYLSIINCSHYAHLYNEGMGKVSFYTGKYEDASKYYAISRSYGNFAYKGDIVRKIISDIKINNYEEALSDIRSNKESFYNYIDQFLLGYIYDQQEKYEAALSVYKDLLDTNYKKVALYKIGYILLKQRKYKEASEFLEIVYEDIKNNVHFDGAGTIKEGLLEYCYIISLIKTKQYMKAIDLFEKSNLLKNDVYSYYYKMYAFCCRMANETQAYHCNSNYLSYSGYQSEYYNKEAVYSHIIRRHIEQSSKSGTILVNTNIDELWDFAINNLSDDKIVSIFGFCDVYCIDYPNCGINGEDKLIVVTNPGTNEIITLYPEFGDKVYLHTGDGDEEARSVYTSDDFKGTDDIIRVLEKDE